MIKEWFALTAPPVQLGQAPRSAPAGLAGQRRVARVPWLSQDGSDRFQRGSARPLQVEASRRKHHPPAADSPAPSPVSCPPPETSPLPNSIRNPIPYAGACALTGQSGSALPPALKRKLLAANALLVALDEACAETNRPNDAHTLPSLGVFDVESGESLAALPRPAVRAVWFNEAGDINALRLIAKFALEVAQTFAVVSQERLLALSLQKMAELVDQANGDFSSVDVCDGLRQWWIKERNKVAGAASLTFEPDELATLHTVGRGYGYADDLPGYLGQLFPLAGQVQAGLAQSDGARVGVFRPDTATWRDFSHRWDPEQYPPPLPEPADEADAEESTP